MASSLIRGRYVICQANLDGTAEVIADGAVFQRDGEIIEVGPYAALRARYTPDEEIGSSDSVLLPGLINAHHHVGLTPFQLGNLDLPLESWITSRWRSRRVDPYLDTMYGAITMLESGITTVMHNDASAVRYTGSRKDALEWSCRVLQAYQDSGMRVAYSVFFRDQNRLVYENDAKFLAMLPPALSRKVAEHLQDMHMPHEEYLSLFEALHEAYGRNLREHVRILLSPANVQWCSDDFLRKVKDYAGQHRTGIHIHLLETPYQKLYGLRTWGKTPLEHLHDLGFLGPEVSCAHGVWVTERDIELLAEAETTVCHNPSSNLRLKSGIAPVNRMVEKGVPVAIGIDEAGLNDDKDMFQEMRLAAKLHREPGVDAPQPASAQVLHMATVSGAKATMFGNRIGALEAGRRADAVLVNLKHITEPYLDPDIDIVDAVLYRGRAIDVETVIVDGEVLLRDRQCTRIDRERIMRELRGSLARELTPDEKGRRELAEELLPYVHGFYSRWQLEKGQPHYLMNRSS